MSSIVLNSLRSLKNRVVTHRRLIQGRKMTGKRAFTKSAFARYGQTASESVRKVAGSKSPTWLSWLAAPAVGAAFWDSSENNNTLEKVNEDIEELALHIDDTTEENAQLAMVVIHKIMSLSDKEIRRDTEYVLAAISSAAKIIAQVNPYSSIAEEAVKLVCQFAKRLDADPNQPANMKLDALRCGHKAEYFVYVYRQDFEKMKMVLEKDLAAVQRYDKASGRGSGNGGPTMSHDESQALWMLAAVLGNLDDPATQDALERSLGLFQGITKETLTPELNKLWIERIVTSLSHGFTLEFGNHTDCAKQFKRIALALYEQYQRIAPEGADIPVWKELESRTKASALAGGP